MKRKSKKSTIEKKIDNFFKYESFSDIDDIKIIQIYDLIYKYEYNNDFEYIIEYIDRFNMEYIIIEVFSDYNNINNDILKLNLFDSSEYICVQYYGGYRRRLCRHSLAWMVNVFGSFKDGYQKYRRKRNIEKL